MSTENIKASNSSMSDKQFKLCDLIPEFSRFRSNEDKIRIGCQSIDNSLFVSTRKGEKYFKPVMLFFQSVIHEMLLKMELILGN